MLPIAIVLAIGLAIALERAIYLFRVSRENGKAIATINPMLQNLDFNNIASLSGKSAVTGIFQAGIQRMKQTPKREEIEYAMEEEIMDSLPQLEKRTQYLATLANISTLLGPVGDHYRSYCSILSGSKCRSIRKSNPVVTIHFGCDEHHCLWPYCCYSITGLSRGIAN